MSIDYTDFFDEVTIHVNKLDVVGDDVKGYQVVALVYPSKVYTIRFTTFSSDKDLFEFLQGEGFLAGEKFGGVDMREDSDIVRVYSKVDDRPLLDITIVSGKGRI